MDQNRLKALVVPAFSCFCKYIKIEKKQSVLAERISKFNHALIHPFRGCVPAMLLSCCYCCEVNEILGGLSLITHQIPLDYIDS